MATFLQHIHKANNLETLADFFLSSIGLANPPRRQYDHGYDFYCFLSETTADNENLLKFDYPFTIQIKSGKSRSVTYGKPNSKDWRAEQVDWLFRHQTPFFIGFIDTDNYELKIYDTTGIWFLMAYDMMNFAQIKFQAGETPNDNLLSYFRSSKKDYSRLAMRKTPKTRNIANWNQPKVNGIKYIIDMGNPIVTINVESTKDFNELEKVKKTLSEAIKIETKNITNRDIGLKYFSEIKNNITNHPKFFCGSAFNEHDTIYASSLLESIRPALISLYINSEKTKIRKLKELLAPLLKEMPPHPFFNQLVEKHPDVFNWGNLGNSPGNQ